MGIARSVIEALRTRSFDAIHLLDEGLQRLEDHAIIEKARVEKRIILTNDLDFSDLMASSGENSPSFITFRLSNMKGENVVAHLLAALPLFANELETGAALSISDRKARCRKLPLSKKES